MSLSIDFLVYLTAVINVVAFLIFYFQKNHRCNPEFANQLHCVSGIILCNKPFFGFLVHSLGGMILLSVGLNTRSEASLLMLALMYLSLSAVVNFDVKGFKPIHFTSLAGVLIFSMAFVWMQCSVSIQTTYTAVSAAFVLVILFNCTITRWDWPWMDVQALVEIVWILCLLTCVMAHSWEASDGVHT